MKRGDEHIKQMCVDTLLVNKSVKYSLNTINKVSLSILRFI